jgi:hypothetical protein
VATVEPIRLDEIWQQRDVTLVGVDSAAVFAPFARHTEAAEIVVVHRDGAERVVMLPWHFWQRIAATIRLANGDPPPPEAAL